MSRAAILVAASWLAASIAGCTSVAPVAFSAGDLAIIQALSTRKPVPADQSNPVESNAAAVELGRSLFHDTRLSRSGQMSCATCHDVNRGWADGRTLPISGPGAWPRHTPSLWNVAYNRWFFWDGRSESLWAQALQPIESPDEMAGSRGAVVALLRTDPELHRVYQSVFGPLPVDDSPGSTNTAFANVGRAIAAFERTLVTTDTPFDRFAEALRSNDPAGLARFPAAAQRGLALFVGPARCVNCHHGGELTDFEFHSVGLTDAEGIATDPGRYDGIARLRADPFNSGGPFSGQREPSLKLRALADREDAWSEFKTPSLRNVERTAPYMHDGRFTTLDDVVAFYSTLKGAVLSASDRQHLTPLNLTREQQRDLVAFLKSLTSSQN